MDLPRVLQARDLILFWLAVGAIGGSALAGAALMQSKHTPRREADAVVLACEAGPDTVVVVDANAGNVAFEGCRESPDNWTPPY